ncbi:MAG: hypothetical protein JAZ19_16250, partial [Candidatus Thiodiazotropha taylori]|nr:hypothetical protein [Candidatus Thiodiazotropha taylori]
RLIWHRCTVFNSFGDGCFMSHPADCLEAGFNGSGFQDPSRFNRTPGSTTNNQEHKSFLAQPYLSRA